MPYFSPIEALGPDAIGEIQDRRLRAQYAYLWANSPFYRRKFEAAGLGPDSIRTRADLARVPFTLKPELRDSLKAAPPLGEHLAAALSDVIQIQASSGTTGSPSYVGLTRQDAIMWQESSARSLFACGIRPGDRVLHGFSMSKGFVGGLPIFQALQYMGALDIPIGADGGVDRLLAAAFDLKPQAVVGTPNFLLHLAEVAQSQLGRSVREIGVRRLVVGGEPGGGIPALRERIAMAWGATVCELMGGTDLGVIYWAECDEQAGMHMTAPDHIIAELIDPVSGEARAFDEGATGELVYTAIHRQASPVFRFRSGDHVVVTATRCRCGRAQPMIRCFGRTDDMLIVRGVNLFPSAVQDLVEGMRPTVSGQVRLIADFDGHTTQRNLKVVVERAEHDTVDPDALRREIEGRIRGALSVKAEVMLAPYGSIEKPGAAKVKLVLREMPSIAGLQ
ncbi:MAG: phenylacetate--CoA ligase family protein [Burkholderiaceae bacterium]|nr:phenylacetate--CoA ligase family protein [Burkholderiaceae bacterium]